MHGPIKIKSISLKNFILIYLWELTWAAMSSGPALPTSLGMKSAFSNRLVHEKSVTPFARVNSFLA